MNRPVTWEANCFEAGRYFLTCDTLPESQTWISNLIAQHQEQFYRCNISYIRWNRAENPSLLFLVWPMYVSYLVITRIDEGSVTTMVGLDILLMNMTSFALNIWTKFCSQDKNGQSLKKPAWITWKRNSFKFESLYLRDVITKAPLSYWVSVAKLMPIKKFANGKYDNSRDCKRKINTRIFILGHRFKQLC